MISDIDRQHAAPARDPNRPQATALPDTAAITAAINGEINYPDSTSTFVRGPARDVAGAGVAGGARAHTDRVWHMKNLSAREFSIQVCRVRFT